jgi:hypothetical protein
MRSYVEYKFSLHGTPANATTDNASAANAPSLVAHKNTPIFIDLSPLMWRLTIPARRSGLKFYMNRDWENYVEIDRYFGNLFRLVRDLRSPDLAEAVDYVGSLSQEERELVLKQHEERYATYKRRLVEAGIDTVEDTDIEDTVMTANASGSSPANATTAEVLTANASDVDQVMAANAPAIDGNATPPVTAQLLPVRRFLEFLAMWPLLTRRGTGVAGNGFRGVFTMLLLTSLSGATASLQIKNITFGRQSLVRHIYDDQYYYAWIGYMSTIHLLAAFGL